MTDVNAPAGRYREALAELPLSTRRVEGQDGAIVVVPGDAGWVNAALDVAAGGAIAVVVSRPAFAPAADIRRLQVEAGLPVIVERALLRPDSAGDASAGRSVDAASAVPRLLVADGTAPRGLIPVVARDAVGWLRILAGDDLKIVAADGELALLETRSGIAASLSVVATLRSGGGSIRVRALGEVLTEIEVDSDRARVGTSTAQGSVTAPARFESAERLALRRALATLASGNPPHDLQELAVDTELVERVLLGT